MKGLIFLLSLFVSISVQAHFNGNDEQTESVESQAEQQSQEQADINEKLKKYLNVLPTTPHAGPKQEMKIRLVKISKPLPTEGEHLLD